MQTPGKEGNEKGIRTAFKIKLQHIARGKTTSPVYLPASQ
jgi:hypothetical protein